MRKFNLEGPVEADRHYCVPPLSRVNLAEILELIDDGRYFVLHAPRQTGKTSTLLALQALLNAEGKYRCLYVNVETGHAAREDTAQAMQAVLGQVASRSRDTLRDDFVDRTWSECLQEEGPDAALSETLVRWSAAHPQPLVLLVDEIDTLVGDTLISVLRQLRANYDRRPHQFPQTVILCGVLDVRDHQVFSSREGTHVKGGSAFNIKAESLGLGDFSEVEIRELLAQHTAERGQSFEPGVVEHIWALTCGQPWLVNALAYEACFRAETGRDPSRPIRVEAIDDAREQLIRRRVTHLDQFASALDEERVRRVILPMLGGSANWQYSPCDLEYVRDLGLVAAEGAVRIANPIYAEVVPRELTSVLESGLRAQVDPSWYVQTDGNLDLEGLLSAFQDYFREHAESWVDRYGHAEAGPQLVLYAYLHRVVNGGGRIGHEYAVGRGRTDLLIEWRQTVRGQVQTRKYVIECKVRTAGVGLERLIREGLEQTSAYMDSCGAEAGHFVIFDLRPSVSWEKRLFRKDSESSESAVTVWGL